MRDSQVSDRSIKFQSELLAGANCSSLNYGNKSDCVTE